MFFFGCWGNLAHVSPVWTQRTTAGPSLFNEDPTNTTHHRSRSPVPGHRILPCGQRAVEVIGGGPVRASRLPPPSEQFIPRAVGNTPFALQQPCRLAMGRAAPAHVADEGRRRQQLLWASHRRTSVRGSAQCETGGIADPSPHARSRSCHHADHSAPQLRSGHPFPCKQPHPPPAAGLKHCRPEGRGHDEGQKDRVIRAPRSGRLEDVCGVLRGGQAGGTGLRRGALRPATRASSAG